jgi:basic membrane lipoprotein Med (substrate-binding protein (PBP1-ABC) superfamily)
MIVLKRFFSGFKLGIRDYGEDISAVINTILLFTVYFLGVGITSTIAKISGKHFIETSISKKQITYWSDRNNNKKPNEEYYRQF